MTDIEEIAEKYSQMDVETIRKGYDPAKSRTWPFYPIVIPLKDGLGPASDEECDTITWEVWDMVCETYGRFDCLPDAIDKAMELTAHLLKDKTHDRS